MDTLSLVLAGVLGLIGAIIALLQELYIRRVKKKKEPTLQNRISVLTENLKSSVAVITEIEGEISKRNDLVKQQEEAMKRYDILKDVSQTQVEAIAQTLEIPIKRESRKSTIRNTIISLLVAIAFFTLGYFLGGR